MNRNMRGFGVQLLTLGILLFMSSCGEDDVTGNTDFDRRALLQDLGSELIVPNFQALQLSVQSLRTAANGFVAAPNETNLILLQEKWIQSVNAHQHCSAFGFGPASLPLGSYGEVFGVFPVSESKIETNVLDKDFNLSASFDRDVRGFYAVEYLIYGKGEENAVVIAGYDEDRKSYLLLIIEEMADTFDGIVAEWQTSYLQEFVENDGTSAGSSISLLYNEFVKDYEHLKNFKIELPAGLTAGQTAADGSLVEAFYSGISRELIAAHFASSRNIWSGLTKSGSEILGFDDYLEVVVGGPELVASTRVAIENIEVAISDLPEGRLSDHVTFPSMATLRDQLQSNTPNFKSSMSSLLGISITFNSSDGD